MADETHHQSHTNNLRKLQLQAEQRQSNKRKVDQSWNDFNRLQQDSVAKYNKKLKMRFAPDVENIAMREWIQTVSKPDVNEILRIYLTGLINSIGEKHFLNNFLLQDVTAILINVDSFTLQSWREVIRTAYDLHQRVLQNDFYRNWTNNGKAISVYRKFPILECMFNIHQISKHFSRRYQEFCEVVSQYISLKTASNILRVIYGKTDQLLLPDTEMPCLETQNQKTYEKLIHRVLLLLFEPSLNYTRKNSRTTIQTLQATSIITMDSGPCLLAVFEFKVEHIQLQPVVFREFQSRINQVDFKCGKVRLHDVLFVHLNAQSNSPKKYYSWSELSQSNLRTTIDPRYGNAIVIGNRYPLVYRSDSGHFNSGLMVPFNGNSRMPASADPIAFVYLHSFFGELVMNYASSVFGLPVNSRKSFLRFMPVGTSVVELAEYFSNLFDESKLSSYSFRNQDRTVFFGDITSSMIWWMHQYLVSIYNRFQRNNAMNANNLQVATHAKYRTSRHDSAKVVLGLLSQFANPAERWKVQYTEYSKPMGNLLTGTRVWDIETIQFLATQYEWSNAILNYAYIHRFDIAAQCLLSLDVFLPASLCQLVLTYL